MIDNNVISGYGVTDSMTATDAASSVIGKEDFLKLLVAQLAHQDPLEPMENTAFVAQLAQFSSLEQLMSVNSNLGLMQMAQISMTNSQVAGLIGKEIEAKGDKIQLSKAGSVDVNYELKGDAETVTVKISTQDGKLIRTLELGKQDAGMNSATWDGRDSIGNPMPNGTYDVQISAKSADGTSLEVSTYFKGVVTGVSYSGGIPMLEVGDNKVQVGDVIAVRLPNDTAKDDGEKNDSTQ
ncbi:MAG: flagellar hook capping FlgD N-terminal domain-containing protein [Pseudomonadota bacterium]